MSLSGLGRFRKPLIVAAVGLGLSALLAGPASAHIEPDPAAVEAGSSNTISFSVEHGCDGSPTVSVDLEFPDGATDLAGVDADGFTSTVDGQVVTFSGGSLGSDTPGNFSVKLTAPTELGDMVVKVVQTCEKGELAWIATAAAGEPEPDEPAPVVKVTAGPPTAQDEVPADDDHGGTKHDETDHGDDTKTDAAAGQTEAAAPSTSTESNGDSDSGSSTPMILGGAAFLVLLGGAAALFMRRRSTD